MPANSHRRPATWKYAPPVRSPVCLALLIFAVAFVANGRGGDADASADEPKPLTYDWREVGTNHWQIKTAAGEAADVTDAAEGNRGTCLPGMVQVKGKMAVCSWGDELQKSFCSKWINKDFPERCASFDKEKWATARSKLPTKDMSFCIDRFEYPNKKGEYPLIYVNWFDSKKLCESDGKRLCNEEEWTFACEGEDATPYPWLRSRQGRVRRRQVVALVRRQRVRQEQGHHHP